MLPLIDGDRVVATSPLGVGIVVTNVIHFVRNMNDGIGVNPSRTIRSISSYITIMKSVDGIGFGCNSGDGIPTRNIVIFGLFNRVMLNFFNRSMLWHGSSKTESENPGENSIFKNAERENNFEVEKLGETSVLFNHTDSNNIKPT